MAKLKIGVIGANAAGSWAAYAHMPALAAIPEIEVAGLATTREESARKSAEAFGVPNAYGRIADLLASDVELVLVSVKAPSHYDTAMAVLEAKKHLVVEWPMGANLAQSEALVEAAERNGVRAFVSLQARAAPPVRHAAKLVAEGYVGRLYSATVYGTYSYWSDQASTGYSADAANGANVLTIPGGHGLDVMRVLAGEVTSLNARDSHFRTAIMAVDEGREVPMTAPDQFAAVGTLASGAVFSAHFVGAAPHGESYRIELVGDRGELTLVGTGMPEIAPLRLLGTNDKTRAQEEIAVAALPGEDQAPGQGPAYNIYHLWRMIESDLRNGTSLAPELGSGLVTRRVIDAIGRSAAAGGEQVTLG